MIFSRKSRKSRLAAEFYNVMETNTISILRRLNPYSKLPFYDIAVDGLALEELLNKMFPTRGFTELVPTLLNWLEEDPRERAVVWRRVMPPSGEVSKLPILMCPEDLDFSGQIIVAEVATEENYVHWRRLGEDKTKTIWVDPDRIGTEVEWLPGVGPFVFERIQYENVVTHFRQNLIEVPGIESYQPLSNYTE
jgi:hypothetical protein